jgi:hypothetical protein
MEDDLVIPDWLLDAIGGPARCAVWVATILPPALVVNLAGLVVLQDQPLGRAAVAVAVAYVACVLIAGMVDVVREATVSYRAARRRPIADRTDDGVFTHQSVLDHLSPDVRRSLIAARSNELP